METVFSTLAQVFVGALVGTISNHYVPAILEKIGMKWDVKEEMDKLSDILLTIKVVLEDAEEKQVTNELIGRWLRELKDVAYDVEDLLDECATEEALHEPESTGSINCAAIVDIIKRFFMNNFEEIAEQRSRTERIKRFFINKYEEIAEQRSMTKRIKLLINKFEEIEKQKSKFNLFNPSSTSTTRVVNYRVDPRRETSSFPTELKVYGRDEEKECIVNFLIDNINAANLSIYAIVGIGGLGKTTLAQMVYNDNMVKSRFEIKRWVCVSENFEVKSLIRDIIQSGSNNNSQTLDQLQHSLQKLLSGKRFLLVLDDVWNDDEDKWERLKSSLSWGAEGSSIIVTTRSNKVASLMAGSSHDHVCHPNMLSEEDCFSLFKYRAFAEGEGEHHPNLEPIAKEIVKKCGRVPLAAKALGGILRFTREKDEWLFVRDSQLWKLPQDKDGSILPALRLSYKHLPQHLRQCFGYCSIFPKDHIMEKEVLVQLWMANGFLQSEGNMELEDIGNGIFNDLLWRSLFQDVKKDHDGNVVACKMHDLMHDLACSITKDECFSVVTVGDEERAVGKSNTTRHLAVDSNRLFSPNFSSSMSQSFLRTFLQLGMYNYVPPPLEFSNLMYLRVLDLRWTRVETLLVSIGMMKLLRYLDLSEIHIALLPDEIFCNLRNLQTLKLRECNNLERLPDSMSKLTNLRHFDITGSTDKLVGMPVGMGKLKCLHMLSDFIVSGDDGCGVGELQGLDHLGGTLAIRRLRKVRNPTYAINAKLINKQNIRYLQLDWSDDYSDTMPQMENKIAEALQPHLNIEQLDFYHYGGSKFPNWINPTRISSLVKISLINCLSCKHLPTLGLLPHLKVLVINNLLSVKCIGEEFYSGKEGSNMALFPALEELQLNDMPSLEEWKGWSLSSLSDDPSSSASSSSMKEGESASKGWSLSSSASSSYPSSSASSSSAASSSSMKGGVFPVLEILKIKNCPNLRTFPSLPLSIKDLKFFNSNEKIFESSLKNLPHLSDLSISTFKRWAPDQEMVLLLQNLPVLQNLKIINCRLVNLPEGMQNLTSLKSLEIASCHGLNSLNNCLQLLTNLHELSISNCGKLKLLPNDFQNLTTLQRLEIIQCPEFVNLPEGTQSLTSLKFLTIEGSGCFKSLNNCFQLLTNLHSLRIRHCSALELLPSDFQPLISLKVLQLKGLNLTAVPVVGSSTLKTITFSTCPRLTNLPEWITNQTLLQTLELHNCENLECLPEGFHQLTALQRLEIKACNPLLHKRCKEDTGENRRKIAHIPECDIG